MGFPTAVGYFQYLARVVPMFGVVNGESTFYCTLANVRYYYVLLVTNLIGYYLYQTLYFLLYSSKCRRARQYDDSRLYLGARAYHKLQGNLSTFWICCTLIYRLYDDSGLWISNNWGGARFGIVNGETTVL